MTETNNKKIANRVRLAKYRQARKNKATKTIHNLDYFRNTDQSELDSNEGGR